MADDLLNALLERLREARLSSRPVSGEERGLASQFLGRVLGSSSEQGEGMSGGRIEPYFDRPKGTEPAPSPVQDFALMLSKQQHPEAWGAADARVGTYDKPSEAGVTSGGFMHFNPNNPVNKNMAGALDTLRHELSHANGLEDYRANGRPSAYDVSDVSDILHRDVVLPKDRKARK